MSIIYIAIPKIKTNIPFGDDLISVKGFDLITIGIDENGYDLEYIPSYVTCGNFERRSDYMKVTYDSSKIDSTELDVLKSVSVDITDEEFYDIPRYKEEK